MKIQPTETERQIRDLAAERILLLDGAMGTMIQQLQLTEADFRGDRFKDWPRDVRGNNDLLVITKPREIEAIHRIYFEAGADITETNTFSSTSIAQADYGMEALAFELNREGAAVARRAADQVAAETGRPRFVAGAIGPTNRTASISPDVSNPGFRAVSFDDLRLPYAEAARGLIEGGADLILIETVFDTLNAKAAIFAAEEVFAELGVRLPLMISGTITDLSGRTLSGQTPTAFWYSVRHARPLSVGLNCALGAREMRAHIAELARIADTLICAYPNAGLPNEFGEYDERPEAMCGDTVRAVEVVEEYLRRTAAGRQFRNVAMMLPTCPFRSVDDVRGAMQSYLASSGQVPLLTVTAYEFPPQLALEPDEGDAMRMTDPQAYAQTTRSQSIPPRFHPNGGLYVAPIDLFLRERSFFMPRMLTYRMPAERSFDIDYPWQLELAEHWARALDASLG